jgi:hypothetical protein
MFWFCCFLTITPKIIPTQKRFIEILLKVVLNTITLTLDEKIDRNSKIITKKKRFF